MTAAPSSSERGAQLLNEAVALRRQQRMGEAAQLLAEAAAAAPTDARIAFLNAQIAYERGLPASALFAKAQALWPDNPDVLRNRALAHASEGDRSGAERLLTDALRAEPGRVELHRVLSSLRWTWGDGAGFDASYRTATTAQAGDAALWIAWFAALAQARQWARAATVLDLAERSLGDTRHLRIARAIVASELQDDAAAAAAFAALAGEQDDALDLARLRFHLRSGAPERAEAIALTMLSRPVAPQVWPYLSLIWRLTGDPRAAWLDGDPVYHAEIDPGFSATELDELAALLRKLHHAQQPYPEQSVRGGTQTDRSVLLRHEPALEHARARLMRAVERYVASLPAPDPRHPLLGRPRGNPLVAGSWSVLLRGGGHNVAHTHPMGWLSSAFYVELPPASLAGEPPAGYLRLGVPPPELGLALEPLAVIAPKRGSLVLFASTMWHDTVPFADGERLNIAFDVMPGG